MSAKLIVDRKILVSSKKDVRTDLALKFAKQELDGELFEGVGTIAKRQKTGGGSKQTTNVPSTTSGLPTGLEELLAAQIKGQSPIIILPSVSNSKARISVLNAVEFLINGKFEEPNPKIMNRPLSMPIEIEKTVCGRPFRFRLFDDISKFRKDDWKAVVAVFSDGKLWQFSGWPFRTESDLFATLPVYHLRYSDDPIDAALSGSRVKPLLLKRGARHQDSSVMIEFWKNLENSLAQPKMRKFSNTARLP